MYGELHQNGNPNAYHLSVGERGSDVALRIRYIRYRYHANMEYVKSQARHILLRTAHHRARKLDSEDRTVGVLLA